jgi:hypothetical protein
MWRSIALWFFGLLAGAIFGGMIGSHLVYSDRGFFGAIGGMCVFACARLLCLSGSWP